MTNYKNPVVDKLIDDIETLENGPARMAKIRKFREILDEDLPIFVMVHRVGNQLVQPWVKNFAIVDESYLGRMIKYRKVIPAAVK